MQLSYTYWEAKEGGFIGYLSPLTNPQKTASVVKGRLCGLNKKRFCAGTRKQKETYNEYGFDKQKSN